MPRSSRHKSSKHSSREVRDYSDSEKERESDYKEKKGRDYSESSGGHWKDSMASSEKRRSNESKSRDVGKDLSSGGGGGGGGVVIVDEYVASSKKRKEKEKEKENRWNVGEGNNERDLSKSDSKSSIKREESSGFDGEEGKKSGSRVESKHHRSERKESGIKEGGTERERKSSKGEKLGYGGGGGGKENVGDEGMRKQGNGEERGGKHGGMNDKINIGKVT